MRPTLADRNFLLGGLLQVVSNLKPWRAKSLTIWSDLHKWLGKQYTSGTLAEHSVRITAILCNTRNFLRIRFPKRVTGGSQLQASFQVWMLFGDKNHFFALLVRILFTLCSVFTNFIIFILFLSILSIFELCKHLTPSKLFQCLFQMHFSLLIHHHWWFRRSAVSSSLQIERTGGLLGANFLPSGAFLWEFLALKFYTLLTQ